MEEMLSAAEAMDANAADQGEAVIGEASSPGAVWAASEGEPFNPATLLPFATALARRAHSDSPVDDNSKRGGESEPDGGQPLVDSARRPASIQGKTSEESGDSDGYEADAELPPLDRMPRTGEAKEGIDLRAVDATGSGAKPGVGLPGRSDELDRSRNRSASGEDITCGNGLLIPMPATVPPQSRASRWTLAHPWRLLRVVDEVIHTVWAMPPPRPGIDHLTDFEARFLAGHPALRDVLEPPQRQRALAGVPDGDAGSIDPSQP